MLDKEFSRLAVPIKSYLHSKIVRFREQIPLKIDFGEKV